jgi:hypothetical protein
MQTETVFLVVFGVWLAVLTIILLWILIFFRRLTAKTDKGNLVKILEKVLDTEVKNERELKYLEKEIMRLADEGTFHFQKLAVVRFNPFEEMGGDHSFSLALLDAKDTGFVLTGLHTRERTRVYLKKIKRGKSEHELSEEEDRVLRLAKKSKQVYVKG